jgi:signal transduction histidine kinase
MDRVKTELAAATPETASAVAPRVLGMLRERDQSLETMREGLARVRTIVRDLSTFTRDDKAPQFVDVRAVLESTVRLSHGELEHRVRVVRDYDAVPHVVGHAARLGQVFLNLVINAAQAVDDGGTIEIHAESSDDSVMVDVKDDGPGIDAALRERIFQPFFTTKAAGKGTGLGLYISRTLVTEMGGTITALPVAPRGTIMRVTLPRARAGHPY